VGLAEHRSPLIWDVFAVSTYATVSLLFWYCRVGPRARHAPGPVAEPHRARRGMLAMGWRGSPDTGTHELASLLLAGLATPLSSRCTRSSAELCPSGSCPDGTQRSSHRTSSRRDHAGFAVVLRGHPLDASRAQDFITMQHTTTGPHPSRDRTVVGYGYMMGLRPNYSGALRSSS
jgi:molybdopterin-containing oxidoreductase family membrane subunit